MPWASEHPASREAASQGKQELGQGPRQRQDGGGGMEAGTSVYPQLEKGCDPAALGRKSPRQKGVGAQGMGPSAGKGLSPFLQAGLPWASLTLALVSPLHPR